jgi:tRNA pseudouridine65 synthase
MDELPVLFEDDALVAVEKPSGAVVHRTRGAEDAPILASMLKQQLNQRVFPVHRLDRQTSGVIIFAKSSEVASILGADIREQRWRKRYVGLCRGPLMDSVVVDHPVPEDQARRPARTDIDPLETFCDRYTLVRARPHTGRRHQLRYHFKHLRHPLVGDTTYGQGAINRFFRQTFGLQRLFLHAERLELSHPQRHTLLTLDSPLPPDLEQVLTQLRAHQGPVA